MAKLKQADRIERKLDALALALGGPRLLKTFDRVGWATKIAARRSEQSQASYR